MFTIKFKSEDIFVDMSNVDERYIIGYVDKINPKAKLFKGFDSQVINRDTEV